MTEAVADLIEDRDDGAEPALAKSSKVWLDLIADSERIFKSYQDKADNIDKLYASLERLSKDSRDREFQLFWANIEVLKPSVYSRPPVPVVVPQFKDRDPVLRAASELLERCSIVTYRTESIHDVLMGIRDDLVIQARGVPWLRYEAEKKNGYLCQRVCVDNVDRRDFTHDPARSWKEVDWVAKASHLTKSKMRKRFRKASGDAYKEAAYEVRKDDETDDGKKKARVWELWSKSLNKVVWVTDGVDVVLDEDKPHLELEGFFPCPKPAYATVQRRSLIPVPDMVFYKDQLEEINELTARIAALADGVKLRGFYPAGAGDIGDAIEAAVKATTDNQLLIPIANWALVGSGAVKDMIVWLPIVEVVTAIKELIALRKELMDDVYQITGLSDIMRGQTEASETLGAQKLKSQYGSVRIRDRQGEMVRIARDITRIAGEIMAENFSAQSLLQMSQMKIETEASIAAKVKQIEAQILQILDQVNRAKTDPNMQAQAQANPQAAQQALGQAKSQVDGLKGQIDKLRQVPTIEKVMQLLRDQRMRPFALDIETDSTIQPDEDAEKQRATEFTTAIGGYMKETLPLLQTMPQAAPLAAGFLKYIASRFRAGRELDGLIDEFAEQMTQMASQPKGPSPEEIKAKADAETAQADNAERQANAQKTAAEAQAKTLEAQTKAADAESARKIAEQQELDASEGRRVDREGKIRVTDKQIELMDAKRADEIAQHAQVMAKGALEIELLGKKIEQSEVATENSIVTTEAAAKAKEMQASKPKEPGNG